ncbi:hypothetical protein B0T25DRAFT_141638 [Lasiosphaeria hispida]|uniref:Uncharacterized protein n=1 Tax=Lasiosphaeria hispida TaxID=260671 RepID=A0AAJ0HL55_9PEZI|nr:hypothetical protein B0T25DRAFT_141638 [Lasiosphaeria hispida]
MTARYHYHSARISYTIRPAYTNNAFQEQHTTTTRPPGGYATAAVCKPGCRDAACKASRITYIVHRCALRPALRSSGSAAVSTQPSPERSQAQRFMMLLQAISQGCGCSTAHCISDRLIGPVRAAAVQLRCGDAGQHQLGMYMLCSTSRGQLRVRWRAEGRDVAVNDKIRETGPSFTAAAGPWRPHDEREREVLAEVAQSRRTHCSTTHAELMELARDARRWQHGDWTGIAAEPLAGKNIYIDRGHYVQNHIALRE